MDVITIDHLPTLLPVESSTNFSANLLPSITSLPQVLQRLVCS